ncbi:2-hydroxyacid dehydrogenase [Stackebrandtia nassauensis]|uniref:D-isomer specific 2-hydroxyacid dehydrogenase NAD-binding protein n=1 Tax=Stackebrandtia nassauensis (strain DSM 44728 / CIP 108903 / NRRL B-16338 / NBRC 102104 / LLR-40K-21) TaxID=446470 RepID=D3Q3U4_STANL|nr:2-hydroxyacid dehydrogenase [Stackebrandtia nassauensis]ADD44011.1 D-isomer specific 2-hydroxyacid dehydrogenase NAD-binding protein [Stackebrandtia nassauensis DSM 44728]
MKVWIPHEHGRAAMEPIPDGVELEVYDGDGDFPSSPSDVEFWVPPFMSKRVSSARLDLMPGLKVIQLLSAGADAWIAGVGESVTLCDAMGVHTAATSEWAVSAMLASLRGFDRYARNQSRRLWQPVPTDTLEGKRVLIVGAGDIGAAIATRVEAFGARPVMVARRARTGVHAVAELPQLLPDADIVVLIVPLTEATRGMVDATFLAAMPDGAMLVNAARGPVVDTAALTEEVRGGRLRAALDVTDPEPLPEDHPLWTLENVLITPHVGGAAAVPGFLDKGYALVGRQLRRYAAGEGLDNVVSEGY